MIRDQQKSINEIKSMLIQILKKSQKKPKIKISDSSRSTPPLNTRKEKQLLINIEDNQEIEREASSFDMEEKLKITIDPHADKMEKIHS